MGDQIRQLVPGYWYTAWYNLETRACNPLRRLAEALGNTSESRPLNVKTMSVGAVLLVGVK
jgi:hypothetical protein